eukprot:1667975-Pyramimonas_sp.AAC.1
MAPKGRAEALFFLPRWRSWRPDDSLGLEGIQDGTRGPKEAPMSTLGDPKQASKRPHNSNTKSLPHQYPQPYSLVSP